MPDLTAMVQQIITLESRIEALEKFKKQTEALTDLQFFQEWLESLKIKKPVSTDKDKPKFQVGDTIAFWDGREDDIRIVLEVNPNNTMKLMNVPAGDIRRTPGHSDNYTLVYRPGFPREV